MGIQSNFHSNFVDFSAPKFYKVPKTKAQYDADKTMLKLREAFQAKVQVKMKDMISEGQKFDIEQLDKLGQHIKDSYIEHQMCDHHKTQHVLQNKMFSLMTEKRAIQDEHEKH